MKEYKAVVGNDVCIYIDNKQLLQAESAEFLTITDLHNIRSCFCCDDIAHIKGRKQYKAVLSGLKFKKPFENFNFCDLDNFTLIAEFDTTKITLHNCMWNDYRAIADKSKFREKIGITALKMETEEIK